MPLKIFLHNPDFVLQFVVLLHSLFTALERWVSGLNQQFAKLSYLIRIPGVRIPPSPHYRNRDIA